MKSIKVCEYSRSRSFHYDLILQDEASGERSQDQWSSGFHFLTKSFRHNYFVCKSLRSKDICPSLGFNCFMFQSPIKIETGKKPKQDRQNMKNYITYEEQDDKLPGGTLKFSIYVGSVDFFVDKNFEFPQFWGFSENVNILGYGHFFQIFFGDPFKI